MCGRYKLVTEYQKIVKRHPMFAKELWEEFFRIHPELINQVEIFPGEYILGINREFEPEKLWWTIEDFDWKGVWRKAINAKAENIASTPMFSDAFRTGRVLIPATGLYEWQTQPDGRKVRYEITFDEPLFAFAGVSRDCRIKDEIRRCGVILTTHPNEVFAKVHNTKQRQAVVIREQDSEEWLDPKTPLDRLKKLMAPLPSEETHARIAEEEAELPLFP